MKKKRPEILTIKVVHNADTGDDNDDNDEYLIGSWSFVSFIIISLHFVSFNLTAFFNLYILFLYSLR